MKFKLSLILLYVFIAVQVWAQSIVPPGENATNRSLVGLGIYLPMGNFSNTHVAGVGLDYSRSNHRFGNTIRPTKFAGWMLNGGLQYFLGKEVDFNSHAFRYGGYLNVYAMGGAMINPIPAGYLALNLGPSFDIYQQSANVGARVQFTARYFVSPVIAVGAGVFYLKHSRSEALIASGLTLAYAFK
jgi:hypothetical protein